MKTLSEIRRVKKSLEEEIMGRPGVTGCDVGPKIVKGKKTGDLSIRVYVEKKEDVPKKDQIPKAFLGVKSDVIERKFVLHQMKAKLEDLKPRADTGTYDPLVGGISLGPCRVIGGYVYTGTLGAIVRDNASNAPMLLSNFHVMCVDDAWGVGDTMAQPSRVDTGSCPADVVGTLQRSSLGGQVDCAVADITARSNACEIVDIGAVNGTGTATVEMAVRKRGRTTGLTYGIVDTVDLTVSIDYGDGLGSVTLTDQIGIDVDPAQSVQFGNSGDSGSVVVDDDRNIVGLYFAGTDDGSYGVANPIQSVLAALNISVCVPKIKEIKEFKEPKEFKEFKELKEFKEPKEFKEFKEFRKEFKEPKEFKESKERFKEFKEKDKDIYEDFPGGPFDPGPFDPGPWGQRSLEERLARLETVANQLVHFINPEMRPELARSALAQEPDLRKTQEKLQKEASDAKQAKDSKDVEKPREQ